jgi:hypothetical protein
MPRGLVKHSVNGQLDIGTRKQSLSSPVVGPAFSSTRQSRDPIFYWQACGEVAQIVGRAIISLPIVRVCLAGVADPEVEAGKDF